MNPYPFSFNQSTVLKKSHYGKTAKKIRWKELGTQRLMTMSSGEMEIHLKVDTSDGQFFFQRKHLIRLGLDIINGSWENASLPDSFSKICVEFSKHMRQALLKESKFSKKQNLRNHAIYAFQTEVPYVKTSAMNEAKVLFLDVVRQKIAYDYPGLNIECQLLPHVSSFQSKSEFLLHVESKELQDESFESEIRLDLKNMEKELDEIVGKQMDNLRKFHSENDSKLNVFVHDALFSVDTVREHDFSPGEKVLEITQDGLSIGVECAYTIPAYGYQQFQVYSLMDGKNKKILFDEFRPFGNFYSTFDLKECVLQLSLDYKEKFHSEWKGLYSYSMERLSDWTFVESNFYNEFYHQILDNFDIQVLVNQFTDDKKQTVSALMVMNDKALLNDENLYKRVTHLLETTLTDAFDVF